MLLARLKSAMLVSSVVPVSRQIVAPLRSLVCATPRLFFTMKVWPVKKFTAGSPSPRLLLRAKVSSESRISTSISPEASTVKRSLEVVPIYLTFSGSPSVAVASARHSATSNPCHLPAES